MGPVRCFLALKQNSWHPVVDSVQEWDRDAITPSIRVTASEVLQWLCGWDAATDREVPVFRSSLWRLIYSNGALTLSSRRARGQGLRYSVHTGRFCGCRVQFVLNGTYWKLET